MATDKNTLISAIVPVYGVEQYLSECIESLIGQTYPSLEIILVDDGSPDRCGEICDEYARKDGRIVVLHKENGGVSAARRDGFGVSTGEWVTFVDADDTLPQNAIELLVVNATRSDCIVGMFDTQWFTTPPPPHTPPPLLWDGSARQAADVFRHILRFEKSYRWELCGKLLKRSLLSKEILDVDRKIKVFEDYITTLRYLSRVDYIVYIPEVVYNYRQRTESSTSGFSYTLDLVKTMTPLVMEAVGNMPGEYTDEWCVNQLFLLSAVIGDKRLSRRDEWFLQVRRLSGVSTFSAESKLSLFLVEHCPMSCVRRYVLFLYQWFRKIVSKRR